MRSLMNMLAVILVASSAPTPGQTGDPAQVLAGMQAALGRASSWCR